MIDRIQALKNHCEGLDYEIFRDDVLMANAKIGSQHYGIDLSQCTSTFILNVDGNYIALIIQGSCKIDFKKGVSLINPNLRTLIDTGVRDLPYCYGGYGVEKYTLKIRGTDLVHVTHAELGDFTQRDRKVSEPSS